MFKKFLKIFDFLNTPFASIAASNHPTCTASQKVYERSVVAFFKFFIIILA